MDSLEIANCLINSLNFHGVLGSDELHLIKKLGTYIINFQESTESGSHWVVIKLFKDKIFYCDSYGVICPTWLSNFAKSRKIKKIIWNDVQLQHLKQTNCGKYCVAFCKANPKTEEEFRKFIKLFLKK